MKTLLILLLSSTLTFAQKTTSFIAYVKIALPQTVLSCEYTHVDFLIDKRKVILKTDKIDIDLKVFKRKKYSWKAKDKYGNIYTALTANDGFVFIPDVNSGLPGVAISFLNICE